MVEEYTKLEMVSQKPLALAGYQALAQGTVDKLVRSRLFAAITIPRAVFYKHLGATGD